MRRIHWTLFFLTCFFTLLALAQFFPLNGDEGVYLYQAQSIANGKLPVRDFFASQPFMFYAPYALTQVILPGLFSARLLSVIFYTTLLILVAFYTRHYLGDTFGIAAALLLFLNISFIERNIIVKHYMPANLFLFASFFFLSGVTKRRALTILISGLLWGLAVNSRIILAASGPLFFALIWKQEGKKLANAAFFFAGALVSSSYNLYFMLVNFTGLYFNLVGWRVYSYKALGYDFAHPIYSKISETGKFLIQYGAQNFVLAFIAATGAVRFKRFSWPMIFTITITVIYLLSDQLFAEYLNQVIPFLVVWCVFELSRFIQSYPRAGIGMYAVGGLAYILAVVSLFILIKEAQSSIKSIDAVKNVAHWIETNTSPNDTVLSWFAAPVAESGRRMPSGLEQGFHTAAFFCDADQAKAIHYHFSTCQALMEKISRGEIPFIIDDSYAGLVERNGFQEYRRVLQDLYQPVYSYKGYTVYRFIGS